MYMHMIVYIMCMWMYTCTRICDYVCMSMSTYMIKSVRMHRSIGCLWGEIYDKCTDVGTDIAMVVLCISAREGICIRTRRLTTKRPRV